MTVTIMSRHSSSNYTESDDDSTPDAVAKRLRDKIRLQAEALLSRCDESTSRSNVSRQSSRVSTESMLADATATMNGMSPPSSSSLTPTALRNNLNNSTLIPTLDVTATTNTTALSSLQSPGNSNITAAIVTPSSLPKAYDNHHHDSTTLTGGGNSVVVGGDGNHSCSTTRSSSPSIVSSISTTTGTSSANDLTKRIQKLALERQQHPSNHLFNHDNNQQRLKIVQGDTSSHLSSVKTFEELQLPINLLHALYQMGFNRPSYIQEVTLPRILQGRNVIGQAQSGSGKTVAFTIGMLYRIDTTSNTTQALCVTPTRELAIQIVDKAILPMSVNIQEPKLRVQLAIAQCDKPLTSPRGDTVPHIVVGTPGKIVDWMKRRIIDPQHIKVFVLDEADTMVESGSGHRANSLLIQQKLSYNCQCLFFSATFSPSVLQFSSKIMNNNNAVDKILIEDGPEYLVLDIIKQLYVDTRSYRGGKLEFLADIYSLLTIGQSIVFVGRKSDADAIYNTLQQAGYTCSLLHGAVEPTTRDTVMEAFRNGESNVLITTNVLARGVDVDNVCLVVNYDLPLSKNDNPDYETYLHRIGRTGRFGRKGTAINLIDNDASMNVLKSIERHFCKRNDQNTNDENTTKTMMIQEAMADPESLADLIEI